jgi:hypothetical protein
MTEEKIDRIWLAQGGANMCGLSWFRSAAIALLEAARATAEQPEPDALLRAFKRIEALRKGLFEARDAMRVMSNWVTKSDPAGHSWAVRMVDRANDVLSHKSQQDAAIESQRSGDGS